MNIEKLIQDNYPKNKKHESKTHLSITNIIFIIILFIFFSLSFSLLILIVKVKDQAIINHQQKEILHELKESILASNALIQQNKPNISHCIKSIANLTQTQDALKIKLNEDKHKSKNFILKIKHCKEYESIAKSISTILTPKQYFQLEDLTNHSIVSICYRSSRDSFDPLVFHSYCDNLTPTVTLIKSTNDDIFGGFTQESWDGKGLKNDKNAFLFSLKFQRKFPIIDQMPAINVSPNHLPIFGEDDVFIGNDGKSSHVKTTLKSFGKLSSNPRLFAEDKINFNAIEIEVFQMIHLNLTAKEK